MSNGDDIIVCCILGLCCAARSERQLAATVKLIHHQRPHFNDTQCHNAAVKLLEKHNYFDGLSRLIDESAA